MIDANENFHYPKNIILWWIIFITNSGEISDGKLRTIEQKYC